MAQLLRMPEVAAGGTKAVLASWSVSENVAFTAEDTLAEIETDKANIDLEAEADGIILKLLVNAGSEVDVGEPIALLGTTAEQDGDITAMLTELGVQGSAATTNGASSARAEPAGAADNSTTTAGGTDTPASTGGADASTSTAGVADAAASTAGVAEPADPEGPAAPDESGGKPTSNGAVGVPARIFASPLARQLARDAGLTLDDLTPGSGPGGRVRRSDVQAAITRQQAAPAPTTPVKAASSPLRPHRPHRLPRRPPPPRRRPRPATSTSRTPSCAD